MKLPAYPKYKPSGVEWLGEVPDHWEVKRLKTSATCWVSNVDKVPAEDELPVRLCNYTDVYYHDHITPDMELMETTATADEIRRFGLRVGDVVITKDSEEWNDIAVPALVKKTAPDLVCGYHLAIIRCRPTVLLGDYLLRAFQSCAVNQQFQVAASGVTRYGLPKSSIGDAWIPLPDPAEQRGIAAFLDRETGRLDRLVAKKRELIERLQEKRAALIARTVTRGLNPTAKLKPSGIEWLGDIPAHWEFKKLRYLCEITTGDKDTVDAVDEGEFPFFVRSQTVERIDSYSFDCEAVLTAGDGVGVGKVFHHHQGKFAVHQRVYVLHNFRKMSGRYLFMFMKEFFARVALGGEAKSTVDSLRRPIFTDFVVLIPPLPEQRAIADYLDRETAKIDGLVAKVGEAVERLQEYRTALITAAVTGKIDVRKER